MEDRCVHEIMPDSSAAAPSCRWPLAAASRIRVKVASREQPQLQQQHWWWRHRLRRHAVGDDDDNDSYCRFYYNSKSGTIELIPCVVVEHQQQQRHVYDDNDDIRILEHEPSYQSYVATLAAARVDDDDANANARSSRIKVVDSFHPKDVIGANLSLEDGNATTAAATASINIYYYPKLKSKKREACLKQYTLDPQCCMDFADVRLIIQAIQKLSSQPSSSSSSPCNNINIHSNINIVHDNADPPPPSLSESSQTTNSTSSIITPMKCLVILNPYSGGGGSNSIYGAKNVYTTIVRRMLSESTNVLEFDTLVTRHAGHARERMKMRMVGDTKEMVGGEEAVGKRGEDREEGQRTNEEEDDDEYYANSDSSTLNTDAETKDVSHYNAIIAMGGDGILFEIFQGIHARSDEIAIFSSMKFGILPCGTYNGLATSLLHWSSGGGSSICSSASHADAAVGTTTEATTALFDPRDYVEIMFHVCKGYTSTLDVARYQVLLRPSTTNNKAIMDFTTTTPGSSAIDTSNNSSDNNAINDNKCPERDISYLSFLTFAWGLIADCDYESECLRWLGHIRSDIWAVYRGILCRKRYRGRFTYLPPPATGEGGEDTTTNETDGSSRSRRRSNKDDEEVVVLPKLGEPLPKGWVTYDCEDFLVFWVCNTSHAAHNMHTCSVANMNDGLFHVLIVRSSCSRLRLLLMLLHLDTGGHMEYPGLEYVPCIAYQFEPLSDVSYNVLDGELLEDGTVQACLMPGGAQFFVGEGVGGGK